MYAHALLTHTCVHDLLTLDSSEMLSDGQKVEKNPPEIQETHARFRFRFSYSGFLSVPYNIMRRSVVIPRNSFERV